MESSKCNEYKTVCKIAMWLVLIPVLSLMLAFLISQGAMNSYCVLPIFFLFSAPLVMSCLLARSLNPMLVKLGDKIPYLILRFLYYIGIGIITFALIAVSCWGACEVSDALYDGWDALVGLLWAAAAAEGIVSVYLQLLVALVVRIIMKRKNNK